VLMLVKSVRKYVKNLLLLKHNSFLNFKKGRKTPLPFFRLSYKAMVKQMHSSQSPINQ
jgi:hypothetical protein